MRLRLVVWLMERLSYCLPLTMQYTPPSCYYMSTAIKPPTDKKASDKGKK